MILIETLQGLTKYSAVAWSGQTLQEKWNRKKYNTIVYLHCHLVLMVLLIIIIIIKLSESSRLHYNKFRHLGFGFFGTFIILPLQAINFRPALSLVLFRDPSQYGGLITFDRIRCNLCSFPDFQCLNHQISFLNMIREDKQCEWRRVSLLKFFFFF